MKKRFLAGIMIISMAIQGAAFPVSAELETGELLEENMIYEIPETSDGGIDEVLPEDGRESSENMMLEEENTDASLENAEEPVISEEKIDGPEEVIFIENTEMTEDSMMEDQDAEDEDALSDSVDSVYASASLDKVRVSGFEEPLLMFPGKKYEFEVAGDGPKDGEAAAGDTRWVPAYYVFQEETRDFENTENNLQVTSSIWSEKGIYSENIDEDALDVTIFLKNQEYTSDGTWKDIEGEDGTVVYGSVTAALETAALPKISNYTIMSGKTATVTMTLPVSSDLEIQSTDEAVIKAEISKSKDSIEDTDYDVRFTALSPGTADVLVIWKVPEGDITIKRCRMTVAEAVTMAIDDRNEYTFEISSSQDVSVSSEDENIASAFMEVSESGGTTKTVRLEIVANNAGKVFITVRDTVNNKNVMKYYVRVMEPQSITVMEGCYKQFRFSSSTEPSISLENSDSSVAEGTYEQYMADDKHKIVVTITGKKPGTARVILYNKDTAQKIYIVTVTEMAAPEMQAVYNSTKGGDVRWKKAAGAYGYAVYRQRAAEGKKKVAVIDSPDVLQYYDQEIRNGCWGRVYHYYVRALYKTSDGSIVEGRESDKLVLQRLAPVTITKAENKNSGAVNVSWKCTVNDNKALGYEVQYAYSSTDLFNRSGTFKKIRVDGRKNLSTVIKNLSAGKTCWIRVRCYVNYTHSVTGKQTKTWSQYSEVKSVVIKK